MERNFTRSCFNITLSKVRKRLDDAPDELLLCIASDFRFGGRKSVLYVNEKNLAEQLERVWKKVKTKKVVRMQIDFDESDYYDDEVDVYTSPVIVMNRGKRRAQIGERTHGSIPKEWEINFMARFSQIKTFAPVVEVIETVLQGVLTPEEKKAIRKELMPVINTKKSDAMWRPKDEGEDY